MPRIDISIWQYSIIIGSIQLCAGCAKGDDPETVALIHTHVPPRAINTQNDENGINRIYGLGLPNTRSSLEILPRLRNLDRLTSLNIPYDGLTDDDLKSLPTLPRLRELRMGSNHITDEGLKYLAGLKDLRYLNLRGTNVRGFGLVHLKDSANLERLNLGDTPLDDSAIPHIVKNFRKLKRFDFDETQVTVEGLMHLADLHWLVTIATPKLIEYRDDPEGESKAFKGILRKYNRAYLESLQKARAAGEETPSRNGVPFGGIDG